MANQPDFDLLGQSFQTISTQMKLMANVSPENDRKEAQRRHDEIIQWFQTLSTRLDHVETAMDRFNTKLEGLSPGMNLTAKIDGVATSVNSLTTNLKDLTTRMGDIRYEVLAGFRTLNNKAIMQEQNSIARSLNSSMTRRSRLRYIDPTTGASLDFFPDSIDAVNKLEEYQLNRLMDVFDLSRTGSMEDRRSRLIKRIQVGYMN